MTVLVTNNAWGTLANPITNVATSVTLTTGQGARFPSITGSNVFYATLSNSSNVLEIVQVTATAGDVFTIVRAQDGTTASAYSASDRIELRPTAALFNSKLDINTPSVGVQGGSAGTIPYQSAANVTAMLAAGALGTILTGNGAAAPVWLTAGTSGYVLQANGAGSAVTWVAQNTLSVLAAVTATNLAGGSGGTIPYQSAAATTAMLANGSAGQVLSSNGGTAAPSWLAQSSITAGGCSGNSATATLATTATTANALNTANTYQVTGLGIGTASPATGLKVVGAGYTVKVSPSVAASTTIDCSTSNDFRLAMGTNITTLTVSNPGDAQTINVRFKQDATGSRTVAWPSAFKWPGGTVPVLSTAANALDLLCAQYDATDASWACSLMKGLA